VIARFVNIGGIAYHHCLNILFPNTMFLFIESSKHK